MARCAVIPHRGPSRVPPCKAAWLPQPGGLAAPSRWTASAYVLPSSDIVAAAEARVRRHARPRPPPRLRPPILSGWELRIHSQKEVIAFRVFSPASKALIIAGGERSAPISAVSAWCGTTHAGQCSSVCCAESSPSSQWWHLATTSLLIRYRYSLKQPCPVRTYVTLYVKAGPPPSSQSPQCGRTASTTLNTGAPVLVSSRERHASSRACLTPALTSAPARPPSSSGCPRVRR
jgi:hypothetical protein